MTRLNHISKILIILLIGTLLVFASQGLNKADDETGKKCQKQESMQAEKCGAGCRANMQEEQQGCRKDSKQCMKEGDDKKCGSTCMKADTEKTCGSNCLKNDNAQNNQNGCKREKISDSKCSSQGEGKHAAQHQMKTQQACNK